VKAKRSTQRPFSGERAQAEAILERRLVPFVFLAHVPQLGHDVPSLLGSMLEETPP